jgi:hypothetical protein
MMQHLQGHKNYKVLEEPLSVLQSRCDALVGKWKELYLLAFGRKSFFSPDRVQKVFEEMTRLFLWSLKHSDWDHYFSSLKQRGRYFSKLGVPFEEVILCLKLFEEAALAIILRDSSNGKTNIEDILLAFDELNHISTSIFAVSYFRTVKKDWELETVGFQKETEELQAEMKQMHDNFLSSATRELSSMNLLISGINKKLRKSVIQNRQLHLLMDQLDREPSMKNFLKITDKFLKQILPSGAEIIMGIFDEGQRKTSLYSTLASSNTDPFSPIFMDEVFYSQLPMTYQEALFSTHKSCLTIRDSRDLPSFLLRGRMSQQKEFLFLSLKKYRTPIGWLLIGTPTEEVFHKLTVKHYQRLGKVIANALFSLLHFNRQKKHDEFISILDQLDERMLERHSMETTLDFCLGSLIELLGVERASVMLLDKEKKTMSIYAAKGHRVYPFTGIKLNLGEGIAGWCARESKIIAIPRMKNGKNASLFQQQNGHADFPHLAVRSLLCVPLTKPNEVVGVLNLSTLNFHKNFEQTDINMASQFAQRISKVLTGLASMKEIEDYVRLARQ